MAVCTEMSIEGIGHAAGLGTMAGLRTHAGAGVRWHVIVDLVLALGYDVSEKHSETNRHLTRCS
jgi:hypothetical protein